MSLVMGLIFGGVSAIGAYHISLDPSQCTVLLGKIFLPWILGFHDFQEKLLLLQYYKYFKIKLLFCWLFMYTTVHQYLLR